MTDLTPRLTEYKGIVFRSKSEAMFARYLELEAEEDADLCGPGGPFGSRNCISSMLSGFQYEPEYLAVDGWVPDFVRWRIVGPRDANCLPKLAFDVIEYKPSRPTETYVKAFMSRCDELGRRYGPYLHLCFVIYYGSIWTTERVLLHVYESKAGWVASQVEEDWLVNFEDAVKATRFDLLEPAGGR